MERLRVGREKFRRVHRSTLRSDLRIDTPTGRTICFAANCIQSGRNVRRTSQARLGRLGPICQDGLNWRVRCRLDDCDMKSRKSLYVVDFFN